MSDPVFEPCGTPRGKNKFYEMFIEEAVSKSFTEKIMKPMPMIISPSGPRDASRHWDWKAGRELDIVLPEYKTFMVFDEAVKIKEEDWKIGYFDKLSLTEGTFTEAADASVLTERTIKDAVDLMEKTMGSRRKKMPKKRVDRSDPRKAKFNGRMLGNIILSTTSQIENNTTLNDARVLEGISSTTVEELIAPLFDEFFHNHGDKWQITGPMNLAAQSAKTGKWKNVSALGGEVIHYHSATIGKRDGVCIRWTTDNIIGLDEEMVVDTTIKKFGDKLVHAKLGGNPANRATLIDVLLDFAGKEDVVTAAEAAVERVRVAVAAQLKDDIDRKSEAYGESFGSWA